MNDPREIKIIIVRASALVVGDVFRKKERGKLPSEQNWYTVRSIRPCKGSIGETLVNERHYRDTDLVEVQTLVVTA